MKVAAAAGDPLVRPLMTFSHLIIQLRRLITRGGAIARWFPHIG
jgi:hypothetical protein